ncbi:MAG: hypothetical protein ACOCQR_03845 [bacterium]
MKELEGFYIVRVCVQANPCSQEVEVFLIQASSEDEASKKVWDLAGYEHVRGLISLLDVHKVKTGRLLTYSN